MRVVKNLDDIIECPNCGSQFYLKKIQYGFERPYVLCVNCHEEFYEEDDTNKVSDDFDDSLRNIECAVCDLTRHATSQHELDQMELIKDIFDELVSVIRRLKR